MQVSPIDVRLASREPVEIDWSAASQVKDVRRQVGEKLCVPLYKVRLLDNTGIALKDDDNINRKCGAAGILIVLQTYDE